LATGLWLRRFKLQHIWLERHAWGAADTEKKMTLQNDVLWELRMLQTQVTHWHVEIILQGLTWTHRSWANPVGTLRKYLHSQLTGERLSTFGWRSTSQAVLVQQLRDGMGAGQAAGRLQLVIQCQSSAWPNGADAWTGKGQDRAMSMLLIATEQSASEQTGWCQLSAAHKTGQNLDIMAEHIKQGRAHKTGQSLDMAWSSPYLDTMKAGQCEQMMWCTGMSASQFRLKLTGLG